jgi:hypothetical protein
MAGKIISKDEANKQFGEVLHSISISAKDLLGHANLAEKSVMFSFIEGELVILAEGRKVIHPKGKSVDEKEVFRTYDKQVVLELINSSADGVVSIEQRNDTITLTNGDSTLEFSSLCPPWCF